MEPVALIITAAGSNDDLLVQLHDLPQAQYLRWYLADLGAKSILVESHYFDRDYLSEFASFYCMSSAGYPNVCQRLHYFSVDVDRALIERACSGDPEANTILQEAYLGFIVRRPIPGTPLGRTAVRWYPDQTPALPRVVTPSRTYRCHVAGIKLNVEGLAWQQQDSGVGACATVALWSMLHSSAFDDRHVVPTTAEVTQTAHRAGLSAHRVFPSPGLSFGQLVATVRDSGFAPLVVAGDTHAKNRFSREHFCSALASLIRSGFPVLLAGELTEPSGAPVGLHAVCAVGFRQAHSNNPAPGQLELEDARTEFVYLHDDNLGPAARFRVEAEANSGHVLLRAEPPQVRHSLQLPDPTASYPTFVPTAMLAAAHDDVRVSPDRLHKLALQTGTMLIAATGDTVGLSATSRVLRLAHYVTEELALVLRGQPDVLGRARLALWEKVSPMSLHVGIVRFGFGSVPLLDVLYDTTDSEPNLRAFCNIAYHQAMADLVDHLAQLTSIALGVRVDAF